MPLRVAQWVHLFLVFITFLCLFSFLNFRGARGKEPDDDSFVMDPMFLDNMYEPQHDLNNIKFPVGPPSAALQAKMRRNGLNPAKVAATLEMNDRPQALAVLIHFINTLDDDWTFRVYHCEEIERRLKSHHLQKHLDSGKLTLIPVNIQFPSHPSVSDFFGQRTYWDALAPAEHILTFQFDSIICSQSSRRVEDYFEYDFIGAPVTERFWKDWAAGFVMNGGLSLRRRSSLLRILDEYGSLREEQNKIYLHEDQFFVDMLRRHDGKIPTLAAAKTFSVETIYGENPLGIHKAASYLRKGTPDQDPENLHKLETEWCPEMRMLTSVIL